MRLFFAVDLPTSLKSALAGVRQRDASGDYRWVDPEGMHITLAFLGEQPAARLDALRSVAENAATRVRPSSLRLGEPHVFGRPREPRVLQIQVGGDLDTLRLLHERLESGLRAAGFSVEDRDYAPHITLARRRQRARGGPPAGWPPRVPAGTIPLDRIVLFESRLSPRGATYAAVFQVALGSAI